MQISDIAVVIENTVNEAINKSLWLLFKVGYDKSIFSPVAMLINRVPGIIRNKINISSIQQHIIYKKFLLPKP